MVTDAVVVTLPTWICSETLLPVGVPAGRPTLIWFTPTNCGDRPAKTTVAALPPTSTVGVVVAVRSLSSDAAPLDGVASTAPRPVQRMTRPPGSPILAGLVGMPGIAPAGAARLPSGLMATAMLLT